MKAGADSLVTQEETLVDEAMIAAIEAAAAAVTWVAATGGPVSGGLSPGSGDEVVRTAREISEAWGLLTKVAGRSLIVLTGACGSLSAAVSLSEVT